MFINLSKPEKGENVDCHKDDCDEASMYNNHAIGVYKQEKDSILVGHVPIEYSTLVFNFLNADKENRLRAVATGKQKREVGVVPS